MAGHCDSSKLSIKQQPKKTKEKKYHKTGGITFDIYLIFSTCGQYYPSGCLHSWYSCCEPVSLQGQLVHCRTGPGDTWDYMPECTHEVGRSWTHSPRVTGQSAILPRVHQEVNCWHIWFLEHICNYISAVLKLVSLSHCQFTPSVLL